MSKCQKLNQQWEYPPRTCTPNLSPTVRIGAPWLASSFSNQTIKREIDRVEWEHSILNDVEGHKVEL